MDLYDVLSRAELHGEVARRFGNPVPGRRWQMDARLAGAWGLLETAMKTYDPANAQAWSGRRRRLTGSTPHQAP